MADIWIAGLSTGHNASTCLLKNGEIVFYIEEERLSREKYDDSPYLGLLKIKEYTDRLDWLAISSGYPHSPNLEKDPFAHLALKLGLIKSKNQVVSNRTHHAYHAASGFYASGFDKAVCVIIDAAGSYIELDKTGSSGVEIESVYLVDYPANFRPIYKRIGNTFNKEPNKITEHHIVSEPGIASMYSALSMALGFSNMECGKAMGLSSYGKPDPKIPDIYVNINGRKVPNRNLFRPNTANYPLPTLDNVEEYNDENLAYAIQKATQESATELILKALRDTECKNLVLSGGYILNCVANYEFLKYLPSDVKIFVDPPAYDGGQSIGVAKSWHHHINKDSTIREQKTYCIGPKPDYAYTLLEGEQEAEVSYADVAKLIVQGNIVAQFQGGSEAGPRALGNRSLLFDPRRKDGKDIVNKIKRREPFRPFAGTIMIEHAHDWFDLRGLHETPFMMYAVNVRKDRQGEIPAIVHVDGSCRVQTVGVWQNEHYYKLIAEFYKQTGVPILFNTSFNLAGDPLVETIADALDTLRKSSIEYLYLPELGRLITIKNKE
jgi:carbamoyltransferase